MSAVPPIPKGVIPYLAAKSAKPVSDYSCLTELSAENYIDKVASLNDPKLQKAFRCLLQSCNDVLPLVSALNRTTIKDDPNNPRGHFESGVFSRTIHGDKIQRSFGQNLLWFLPHELGHTNGGEAAAINAELVCLLEMYSVNPDFAQKGLLNLKTIYSEPLSSLASQKLTGVDFKTSKEDLSEKKNDQNAYRAGTILNLLLIAKLGVKGAAKQFSTHESARKIASHDDQIERYRKQLSAMLADQSIKQIWGSLHNELRSYVQERLNRNRGDLSQSQKCAIVEGMLTTHFPMPQAARGEASIGKLDEFTENRSGPAFQISIRTRRDQIIQYELATSKRTLPILTRSTYNSVDAYCYNIESESTSLSYDDENKFKEGLSEMREVVSKLNDSDPKIRAFALIDKLIMQ